MKHVTRAMAVARAARWGVDPTNLTAAQILVAVDTAKNRWTVLRSVAPMSPESGGDSRPGDRTFNWRGRSYRVSYFHSGDVAGITAVDGD